MIHEEICTYEVAKLAKEKGFNVPTSTVKVEKIEGTEKEVWDEEECRYITQWETRSLRIPTQSLLQRWLREEKGIQIYIDSDLDFDDETFVYEWQIANKENFDNGGFEIHRYNSEESHSTYELALEDALKYALENLV